MWQANECHSESQFILTYVHLQDLSIFLLGFHLINKEEKIKVRINVVDLS